MIEDSNEIQFKRRKERLVSFYGDGLEREGNVSELEKFLYPCVKSEGFFTVVFVVSLLCVFRPQYCNLFHVNWLPLFFNS